MVRFIVSAPNRKEIFRPSDFYVYGGDQVVEHARLPRAVRARHEHEFLQRRLQLRGQRDTHHLAVDLRCRGEVSPSLAGHLQPLDRYSRLLQLLPCLRWFKESVLVELFFSGLIGSLSIETVIPFVLKMDVLNMFERRGSDTLLPSSGSTTASGDEQPSLF